MRGYSWREIQDSESFQHKEVKLYEYRPEPLGKYREEEEEAETEASKAAKEEEPSYEGNEEFIT